MNLTGAWWGSYAMPGAKSVAFWAVVTESNGALTGSTSERYPPRSDGETVNALLRGTREGTSATWVKAYDGAGRFAHAVDYAGTLDPAGERIVGEWRIARTRGAFEMRRTLPDADEESIERRESVDARAFSPRTARSHPAAS